MAAQMILFGSNLNTQQPAINGNLSFKKSSSPVSFYQEKLMANTEFFIHNISEDKKFIEIGHKSNEKQELNICQKFIAPIKKFAIHLNEKDKVQPVFGLDVTDGGLGVSCSTEGSLLIWLLENGKIRRNLNGHISEINMCKFFPSGLVVLSGGSDLRLKVWSAEDGSCPVTLVGHSGGVNDACVVERGRNIVSVGRDGACKLWDVGQSKCLSTLAKYETVINSCCIQSINTSNGSSSIQLPNAEEVISDREVATSNKIVSCGCEDGFVRVIAIESRKQIFEFKCESAVNCNCFLSESVVACGTQDGYIHLYDLRNPNNSLSSWKEYRSSILSIRQFGPSNGFVSSTADGSCFIFNPNDGSPAIDLTGPNCDPVYKVAFNQTHLFTCCRDGFIRKYQISHIY